MDKNTSISRFDFTPIGLSIKKARESENITREVMAEMLDITARHLQAVENEGHYPSFDLLIRLITRFHVAVDPHIFPEQKIGKSAIRRRVDRLLDALDDKDLAIIEGTAQAICTVKSIDE